MSEEEKRSFLERTRRNLQDFIYGMSAHEMTRQALKTRGSMEHLFILITMGDLLGVPICRPTIRCDCCPTSFHRYRHGSGGCCARRIWWTRLHS